MKNTRNMGRYNTMERRHELANVERRELRMSCRNYADRVAELEGEGCSTSDAQAAADAELERAAWEGRL